MNYTLLFIIALGLLSTTAVAQEEQQDSNSGCPCWPTDSNFSETVRTFEDEGHGPGGFNKIELILQESRIRYTVLPFFGQSNNSGRPIGFECEAILLTPDFRLPRILPEVFSRHEISREQYGICASQLRYFTPATDFALATFDAKIAGQRGLVQNAGTDEYLAVRNKENELYTDSDISLAGEWTVHPVPCPRIASSAAKGTTRNCFALHMDDPEALVVGTNGSFAFSHDESQDLLLSSYILEPTLCDRMITMCSFRIQVAYYGDKYVSGLEHGSNTLRIVDGAQGESDSAEWTFLEM